MDNLIMVALISATAAVVAAIIGALNSNKLHEIHVSINSRMDELISSSKDSGRIAEQESSKGVKK